MSRLNISLHDYGAACVEQSLPEITLTHMELSHTPDLYLLSWNGTGLGVFMRPDRLRELAAIILDKFPLVAPLPETAQPIEDPRNGPQPMTGDSPSPIFTPLNNVQVEF